MLGQFPQPRHPTHLQFRLLRPSGHLLLEPWELRSLPPLPPRDGGGAGFLKVKLSQKTTPTILDGLLVQIYNFLKI